MMERGQAYDGEGVGLYDGEGRAHMMERGGLA